MKQRPEFWQAVARIRSGDERYAPEAYAFVMEALDFRVRSTGERRHVSGAELVEGAMLLAHERYGMLAYAVLEKWGLNSGSDVGEIVFQLIDAGILTKRSEDAREDFEGLTPFKTRLEERYFEGG